MISGQGVRGGRGGRTERKEANADDLDKDLEAYLKVCSNSVGRLRRG